MRQMKYNHWATNLPLMVHLSRQVSKRLTLTLFPFSFCYYYYFFCIYKCRTLGHWYKQKSYFTPLISSVEDSLGFGLMILMFFWWWWWRGGDGAEPPYALLSSGFVRMLLSLCTLISIVSGLRDSFPFSSFSGNFLRRRGRKRRGERETRSSSWTGNDAEIKIWHYYICKWVFANVRNDDVTTYRTENDVWVIQTCRFPPPCASLFIAWQHKKLSS